MSAFEIDEGASKDDVDWVMGQGDTSPPIEYELLDNNKDPVNLNGTTVRFVMWDPDEASTNKVEQAATINDPDNGLVQYGWSSGDTDTVGYYKAEWEVDYSGDTGQNFDPDERFPNEGKIDVRVNPTRNE